MLPLLPLLRIESIIYAYGLYKRWLIDIIRSRVQNSSHWQSKRSSGKQSQEVGPGQLAEASRPITKRPSASGSPRAQTTDLADVYGNGYRQCVVWWGMRRLMSTKPESDTGPYHTTH